MKTTKYIDALIIGSGFGAAAPALRLAGKGLRTIMIEKGSNIDPYKTFKQTQDPKYLLKYLKNTQGDNIKLNHVEGLGGGSGFYEGLSFRAPSFVFDQQDKSGLPLWPSGITRKILDPYYSIAEKMLSVHQIKPKQVPKTGLVFSSMMKNLGYSVERARYASQGCMDCGRCVTGCIYVAKESLLINYLPQARKAGLEIITDTFAVDIKPVNKVSNTASRIPLQPYRYLVRCQSNQEALDIFAKIVVLGGGTMGTAHLLNNSRSNLPQLSPQVGKNIAFNGSVKIAGLLPDWCDDGDMFTGRSVPGVVSFEFLKSNKIMIAPAKPFPLQVFGSVRISEFENAPFFGKEHLNLMKKLRHRIIFIVALGMTPPAAEITYGLSGKPKLKLSISNSLKNYYKKTKKLLQSILTRNGGKVLNVKFLDKNIKPIKGISFSSSHQVGSCRMADSPARGVVNKYGEVFNYPGLYISDGSVIPSSLVVNTSLTILANAERIAQNILTQLSLNQPYNNLEVITGLNES